MENITSKELVWRSNLFASRLQPIDGSLSAFLAARSPSGADDVWQFKRGLRTPSGKMTFEAACLFEWHHTDLRDRHGLRKTRAYTKAFETNVMTREGLGNPRFTLGSLLKKDKRKRKKENVKIYVFLSVFTS